MMVADLTRPEHADSVIIVRHKGKQKCEIEDCTGGKRATRALIFSDAPQDPLLACASCATEILRMERDGGTTIIDNT